MVPESHPQVDAERSESGTALRFMLTDMDRTIGGLEEMRKNPSWWSVELEHSLERLREARMWLIEHGHGGWVGS